MKGYKIHSEFPTHFIIQHPDGTHFHVHKMQLHLPMLARLSKLPRVKHAHEGPKSPKAHGGEVKGYAKGGSVSPEHMWHKMADGGEVDQPQDQQTFGDMIGNAGQKVSDAWDVVKGGVGDAANWLEDQVPADFGAPGGSSILGNLAEKGVNAIGQYSSNEMAKQKAKTTPSALSPNPDMYAQYLGQAQNAQNQANAQQAALAQPYYGPPSAGAVNPPTETDGTQTEVPQVTTDVNAPQYPGGANYPAAQQNQNSIYDQQGNLKQPEQPQDPYSQYMNEMNASYDQQIKAAQDMATAQRGLSEEQAKIQGQYLKQLNDYNTQYQAQFSKLNTENDRLTQDIMNTKIDPDHYWNSLSTAGKIGSLIGILISGAGAGMSHQPNMALALLNKQIDNDIDAQKANLQNKNTLLSRNLQKYGVMSTAMAATRLNLMSVLEGQLEQAKAQYASPMAQAVADNTIAQIRQAKAGLAGSVTAQTLSLMGQQTPSQNMYGAQANGIPSVGGNLNIAPNMAGITQLRRLNQMNPKIGIDEPTYARATKEYGDYQDLTQALDETDKVFQEAQKNASFGTWIQSGQAGVLGRLGRELPTVTEEGKRYDSAVNSYLERLQKTLAGRVTPESRKLLQNSMPVYGDSPATVQQKLNDIKDIIRGAYNFPTLSMYGALPQINQTTTSAGTWNKIYQPGSAPPKQ